MKNANSLARTMDAAQTDLEPVKLKNVRSRWCLSLNLIIPDGSGNCLVKLKRRKFFRALPDEAEILKDVLGEEKADLDLLDDADIDDYY